MKLGSFKAVRSTAETHVQHARSKLRDTEHRRARDRLRARGVPLDIHDAAG